MRLITILGLIFILIGCNSSASTKIDTEDETKTEQESELGSDFSDEVQRSDEKQSSQAEKREGSFSQDESRANTGSSEGDSDSKVQVVREYLDPDTGKVLTRDTFSLESGVSVVTRRDDLDTRAQSGEFTGSEVTEVKELSLLQELRSSLLSTFTASAEDSTRTESTRASSRSGLSIWFWVLIGLIVLLVGVFFVYRQTIVGRLQRMATFLATAKLQKDDLDTYKKVLSRKERELVRSRIED